MSKKGQAPPNPCAPAPSPGGAKPPPKGGKEEKDISSEKLDYCLTDAVVKCALGALFGAVASTMFLRKRKWPLVAGSGMGIGAAAADCRYQLDKVAREKEQKEKDAKAKKK